MYFGDIGGWDIADSYLKGGSLYLNKDGSITGSGWNITSDGDAYFDYIHGTIADKNGDTATLTGGVNGNGYTLSSNGDASFGGSNGFNYDASQNRVKLGTGWIINQSEIKSSSNGLSNVYLNGATGIISAGNAQMDVNNGFRYIHNGNPRSGLTGTLTFEDQSYMSFAGGILVAVHANSSEGTSWSNSI